MKKNKYLMLGLLALVLLFIINVNALSINEDGVCQFTETNGRVILVTFDTNGGSTIENQIVANNTSVNAPAVPIKSDCYFAGWYSDSELTIPFDFSTPIASSITLYAKWETAPFNMTGFWDINIPSDGNAFVGTVSINEQTGTDFVGTFQVNAESNTNILNGKIIGNNVTFDRDIISKYQNYNGTLDTSTNKATITGSFNDTYTTFKMVKKTFTIKGNSVWRKNGTTADINFMSNIAGTAYYIIDDSALSPNLADFITSGSSGGSVVANTLKSVSLSGLTSGSKYAHIVVKNENGYSNILTISMPYNVYYFDDFESLNENSYPSWQTLNYNGAGNSHQKIMIAPDKTNNPTNVFRLKGSSGFAADSRLFFPDIINISGYAIMEIDMKFLSVNAGSIALGEKGKGSIGGIARLFASNNIFKIVIGNSEENLLVGPEKTFSVNQWYRLKIVLDYTNRKFDVYVDNEKINFEPISAHSTYKLNYIGISSGNGSGGSNEIYTDNIKFYTTSSLDYSVTFETNGGSPIAIQTIKDGENSIKPSDPIKENYLFDGWYSDSSLTTPFDFGTPITKTTKLYAKWKRQHIITFDAVPGVTFDKNGPLTVEDGSSCEITITANLGYRLKSVKVNGIEKLPLSNNKVTLENITENKGIVVTAEKLPFTITVNEVAGAIITPNGTINVLYGDNKDITITADLGYRLKSVKVNGIEKLPLSNNKVTLENITENKGIVVTVEKIKYDVINGSGQQHIIGTDNSAAFRINANIDLFFKAYLNDEELNSEFYTITEGSTIITLKQSFINNLLPGTYNLKAKFFDGGEAKTTFKIVNKEINPKTSDNIVYFILFGSVSLIGIFIVTVHLTKRFN